MSTTAPKDTDTGHGPVDVEDTPLLPDEPVEAPLIPGRAYEGESDDAKAERVKAIGTAYSQATTTLREKHLAEFNALVTTNAEKAGYDWQPQPTKAEKARAQIEALLAANPELADTVEVKG